LSIPAYPFKAATSARESPNSLTIVPGDFPRRIGRFLTGRFGFTGRFVISIPLQFRFFRHSPAALALSTAPQIVAQRECPGYRHR
jgi:hypothetical protein